MLELVKNMLSGKKALMQEEIQELGSAVFNAMVAMVNKLYSGNGVRRYSCTNKLLTRFIEEEASVLLVKVPAALDMWKGVTTAGLNLKEHSQDGSAMPEYGGRFLLTRLDCLHQTVQNDFVYDEQENAEFFAIATRKEIPSLWKCVQLHFYQHGGADVEKSWPDCWRMSEWIYWKRDGLLARVRSNRWVWVDWYVLLSVAHLHCTKGCSVEKCSRVFVGRLIIIGGCKGGSYE